MRALLNKLRLGEEEQSGCNGAKAYNHCDFIMTIKVSYIDGPLGPASQSELFILKEGTSFNNVKLIPAGLRLELRI